MYCVNELTIDPNPNPQLLREDTREVRDDKQLETLYTCRYSSAERHDVWNPRLGIFGWTKRFLYTHIVQILSILSPLEDLSNHSGRTPQCPLEHRR